MVGVQSPLSMSWKWFRHKAGEDEGSGGKSISHRSRWKDSPGRMALFFSVFLVLGLLFLVPFFVLPAIKVVAARSWTPTDCEILASSVARHAGDDGPTYSVEVRYRYEVDGVLYESERYEFMAGSSSGYESKQRAVDALPVGDTATCYVDPENPAEAVIHRGFTWVYLIALMPLIFIAVGGGGMAWR